MPCSVSGRNGDVAVGADDGRRPFASEKLSAMTVETRLVFGKVSHVRKSFVALADFFPVFCREFMARIAGQLLIENMGPMREPGVIDAGLSRCRAPGGTPSCGTGLRLGRGNCFRTARKGAGRHENKRDEKQYRDYKQPQCLMVNNPRPHSA